jgi:alanyl-tRNA synthetase
MKTKQQLDKLRIEQRRLKSFVDKHIDKNYMSADYISSKKRYEEIEAILKKEDTRFSVTDHAVVRYIHRCAGFNTDTIRKALLDKTSQLYEKFGDGIYPIGDDVRCVIKGGRLVTVITSEDDEWK